jgi:uncharacterized protein
MINRILLVLLLCGSAAYAVDAPPSEGSIKQLLEVMQAHKNLDAMLGQMDAIMKNAFQQATQGQTVPAEAQKIFEKCRADVSGIFKEQFTWEKMEPLYMHVYQQSFTQEEVNGMISFYKTPIGQSVINKLPLVMQNSMNETMKMMGPIMQRIQTMQREVVAQMQASSKKSG